MSRPFFEQVCCECGQPAAERACCCIRWTYQEVRFQCNDCGITMQSVYCPTCYSARRTTHNYKCKCSWVIRGPNKFLMHVNSPNFSYTDKRMTKLKLWPRRRPATPQQTGSSASNNQHGQG